MLKSTNEIRVMNWQVYDCMSPKYLYDTCDQVPPSPFLKNEIDKCVGYEKKTIQKQS